MIHTHRQIGILLLEDTCQFDEVGTSTKMTSFRKVAVGEDVARTKVNEVGARSKFLSQLHHVVVGTSRERTGTEGQTVVLVGHSIKEPLDILLSTHDTWQTENLDGGIVGVYAHVHVAFLTDGHNSFEEIFHVFA